MNFPTDPQLNGDVLQTGTLWVTGRMTLNSVLLAAIPLVLVCGGISLYRVLVAIAQLLGQIKS